MMRFIACMLITLFVRVEAHALDHKNLDEGRPLRLEDPYPIAHGEIAIEGGAGFNGETHGSNRVLIPFQILYGALPNSHFEIGTTLLTNPRTVSGYNKSGDLELSGLYNFNQETLSLPALGIKVTVTPPTGINSSGTDVEIKGLIMKSFGRLGLHLNASHVFVSGTANQEGDDLHKLLLGASYPLGAPRYTRLTLVTDVFSELSQELIGAEAGVRYQLTPQVVFDTGAGSEFSGPTARTGFFVRAGASVGI